MVSKDDYRYEVKFGTLSTALPELQTWVRTHRAAFREAHPPRLVNSLYFDTEDWRALGENLAGVPDRAKVRCRWYGPELGVIDGRLELKSKRNHLGHKVVRDLGVPIDLRCGEWASILRELRSRSLGPLGPLLADTTCPTLIVRYRRSYYQSIFRQVRLTVDTELETYDQSRSSRPNLVRANIIETPTLIEVKGPSAVGDAVAEIAKEIPLRRIAYSKYCTGVLDGLGPL